MKRACALALMVGWLAGWLVALPARAHEGPQTGFASIRLEGQRLSYSLTISTLPGIAPDGRGDAPPLQDPARFAGRIAAAVRLESGGQPCTPGA